jgi:hypothetical protein
MANSGGGGRFLRQRAVATSVLPQNNRCPRGFQSFEHGAVSAV